MTRVVHKHRLRAAAGLVLVGALALTGCSAGGSASSTSSAASSVLTVGASSGIPQLNPAIRTFAFEETLFPLLWTGLTKWDAAGKIQPDLAASWTSNTDATSWTFRLNPGAKFSDGSALDAQAVVDTFNYYLDPSTATQESNKLATISSVTAVDPTTVQFTLKAANAFLPESITGVRMIKVSDLADINSKPITSGPYTVSAFTPDSTVTMVQNPDYWGTPAKVKEIDLVKTADSTSATTSIRSGDINVLAGLALSDVSSFNGDSSVTLVKPQSLSQAVTWEVDMTSAPFNNLAARQALAYATDRATILKTAYYGQGVVSDTNTMLAPDNPFHATDLQSYPYDLDKAKALFAQAGVTDGSTLTWWSASAFPEQAAAGQILQASLAKIGIKLDIQTNDTATWAAKFYPAGQSYPGYIIANYQSVPASPAFSMNFLLSGRCECNWNSTAYDAAFASAIATTDTAAQQADWDAAQKLENEEVPLITPVISAPVAATSSSVSGVWLEGGGQVHLEDASVN
ncbi:ABC transporter substrate-binding protein [Subtercola endophyticus]|uniref:ABC transporter substrate-binding protein n=1 Tax=Subtercola endophyticus TaxID=2895559 RepID=UPI001E481141|nr:ABC transporter substrate-binding protein [Subtercola endophyticus]UFS58550.1 ABC transporter substrate-binding protein [Subtercola endophyticus]